MPSDLNPGSGEAVDAGCTCPVIDNGHGKGAYGGAKDPETGVTLFWMSAACPLHGEALVGADDDAD